MKIESVQNSLVKHMVKLRNDRFYRYREKRVFVEGKKIVQELKEASCLFVEREEDIPKTLSCKEVFIVSSHVMRKLSGVKSPEGVVAEVVMPEFDPLQKIQYLLVLDGVNDPGNLGTLLRSGLAFGWEGVFLLNGCCDPYNEKAVRASKGAVFRIPLNQGSWEDLKNRSLPIFVADIQGVSFNQIKNLTGAILILSSESYGVSKGALKIGRQVTIPMSGDMESINVAVAGGILMYALRQNG